MASPACPGVAGIDRLEVDHRHRDPSSSSRPTPPTTVTTPPNWQCRAIGCLAVDHDPTTPRRARRVRARLAPGHCIPTETRSPSCGPDEAAAPGPTHAGRSRRVDDRRAEPQDILDIVSVDRPSGTRPLRAHLAPLGRDAALRSPARGFVVHDVACADRRATSTTHRRQATRNQARQRLESAARSSAH